MKLCNLGTDIIPVIRSCPCYIINMVSTIALELVPTALSGGSVLASQSVKKVQLLLESSGLSDKINTIVIPQIIPEDLDRPIGLENKMDPLDTSSTVVEHLKLSTILTQVTVFTPEHLLKERLLKIRESNVNKVVFVGIPREFEERHIIGPSPNEALQNFQDIIPYRGVILIPTRISEDQRLIQKLACGANFALTQLLFSTHIIKFLSSLPEMTIKPEIILSFGYVPKMEDPKGLIRWLIQDTTTQAQTEMEQVLKLANLPFKEKKKALIRIYEDVVAGVQGLDFPLGVHFECPYGVSEPALETFGEMLEIWTPN